MANVQTTLYGVHAKKVAHSFLCIDMYTYDTFVLHDKKAVS